MQWIDDRIGAAKAYISAALTFVLLLVHSPSARADDLWPLVKEAESAVWGTLTDVATGGEDRLLVISVTGSAGERDSRGPASLRVLERAGRLPEGISFRPGATGFFLCRDPIDGAAELGAVDAWLITGGYIPLADDPATYVAFAALFAARRDADVALDPRPHLLALLESEDATARALALSWLRHNEFTCDPGFLARLGELFQVEQAPEVAHSFLELFLLRGWVLASRKAAGLLLTAESGTLIESALQYLAVHGTAEDRAELLLAFPSASRQQRLLLLESYARMQIAEAAPWWRQSLLSGDPELVRSAIAGMGTGRAPGSQRIYSQLLESRSSMVRRLAVEGLVSMLTPAAAQEIRDYISRAAPGDPAVKTALRALRHPHRYSPLHPGRRNGGQ